MTRAEALVAAAVDIAKHVPDIAGLVDLLELAGGNARLAAALRELARGRPVEVGGEAKPDPEMWRHGRVG